MISISNSRVHLVNSPRQAKYIHITRKPFTFVVERRKKIFFDGNAFFL